MLTTEEMQKNKDTFIELVKSITRPGIDMERLVRQLTESDFFLAPASSKYHSSYEGGLVVHSLNVYDSLCKLIEINYPKVPKVKAVTTSDGLTPLERGCIKEGELDSNSSDIYERNESGQVVYITNCPYTSDTIKIVSLFHDFSKMNFYKKSAQNKKIYSPGGRRNDNDGFGPYDWKSVEGFVQREAEDRFLYGSHEQTAEYMTGTFIPLQTDESIAILHHMGGMAADSAKDNLSAIYAKYPLALLLHLADMQATYLMEPVVNE